MNVFELITGLEKIQTKELNVRVITGEDTDANFWIRKIEVSKKGNSGYELHGEVRLIGEE